MQNANFIPASGPQMTPVVPVRGVRIGPPDTREHQIKLNKKGDVIESIEVTCRCGDTIQIRCEYE